MRIKYTIPAGALYAPYLLNIIKGNHTIIAGTTGSGKSVLENSIVYALLCATFPGDDNNGKNARFIFLDPKKVEFDCYKNLPHTLYYADNIETIIKVLQRVRELIDNRLFIMKKKSQRQSDAAPVYVFIDEIVTIIENKKYKNIVLSLLSDILSISRATNIFCIISTQNPARGCIPATIQINCNCKVALRCNNSIESREIIGESGAENLPKNGFAIVRQNMEKYKIKIPFYSDQDINDIVKFWTRQHKILNKLLRPKI